MLKASAVVKADVPVEVVRIGRRHVWLKDSQGQVHKLPERDILLLKVVLDWSNQ